jgi:hypothetical protein
MNKPKLIQKNGVWICKSNTHVAYDTTPERAYNGWKAAMETLNTDNIACSNGYKVGEENK